MYIVLGVIRERSLIIRGGWWVSSMENFFMEKTLNPSSKIHDTSPTLFGNPPPWNFPPPRHPGEFIIKVPTGSRHVSVSWCNEDAPPQVINDHSHSPLLVTLHWFSAHIKLFNIYCLSDSDQFKLYIVFMQSTTGWRPSKFYFILQTYFSQLLILIILITDKISKIN